MVGGVLVAVSLAAVVADRPAGAGGRAALMLGGQLLPRQHRQAHIAAGQSLAAAVGIPRMHTAPRDQSRQHRAVGERRGGPGRRLAHHGVVAASGLIRRGVQIIAVLKPVALRSQGVIRYHSAHDAAGAIHSSLFQGAHIVAAPEGKRSRGIIITQTGPRRDTACIGIILCLGAFDLTGIVAVGYHSDAVDLADDAGSQRLGGHGTEIGAARDGKGVGLVLGGEYPHKAGRLAAGHCGGVDAVGDGDRAHAVAQKAAAIAAGCAGGDAARYGQVPENRITRASEQACIRLAVVDIQVPDGISAAVKGAAVRLLDALVLPDAYRRPELVLQVDVRRQHGAGSGVLRPAVLAVDDVAERLQILCVGDAVGVLLRAAARNDLAPLGLEGHRVEDRRIKTIRRSVLKPPIDELVPLSGGIAGSGRRLSPQHHLRRYVVAAVGVEQHHCLGAVIDGAPVLYAALKHRAGLSFRADGSCVVQHALVSAAVRNAAAVGDHGARPVVVHTAAAVDKPSGHAAPDAAAVHGKRAVVVHAGGASVTSIGGASHDMTAVHGKAGAAVHPHPGSLGVLRGGNAAGDDAAADGKAAVRGRVIPRPHVAVIGEIVDLFGIAVLQRQRRAAGDEKDGRAAVPLEHMTVQIHGQSPLDHQSAGDADIRRQCHLVHIAVADGVVQLVCRGGFPLHCAGAARLHRYPGILAHGVVRRQHLHRQQRQRHAQRHQGGNHPFSHACSSFSSAGISPRWKSYRISSAWNSRSMMRWATARMSMVPRNASTRCSSSSGTL